MRALMKCLSRVRGNPHARFLGGKETERSLTYPVCNIMKKKIYLSIAFVALALIFLLCSYEKRQVTISTNSAQEFNDSFDVMRESIKDEKQLKEFDDALDVLRSEKYTRYVTTKFCDSSSMSSKISAIKNPDYLVRKAFKHLDGATVDDLIKEARNFNKKKH